jgi:hypothetical protein
MVVEKIFPDPEAKYMHYVLRFPHIDDVVYRSSHKYIRAECASYLERNNISMTLYQGYLSLLSQPHTTYKLNDSLRFRDVIEAVSKSFFKTAALSSTEQIGLEYQNIIPLPSCDDAVLRSYCNSALPTVKFGLADKMMLTALVRRGEFELNYKEELRMPKGTTECSLVLHLGAYASNINVNDCMNTTDQLYDIISDEFEKTIRKPV